MIKKKILDVLVNAGYHKGKSGGEENIFFFLHPWFVFSVVANRGILLELFFKSRRWGKEIPVTYCN